MNILLVHNSYQQPGGEDRVFEMEGTLLERHGHRVFRYHTHNDAVRNRGQAGLFVDTIWNRAAHRELQQTIRETSAEVVHVHNTFPLISPAVYYAAEAERVPVVQTLHNYRLICPAATLYRDGQICEDCIEKRVTWPAVVHSCYRDSRAASLASTAMLAIHNGAGTYHRKVTSYIALTEFARTKFIQAGFPADKIGVKPNFVDPDPGVGSGPHGGYALFMGRLTPEKGIRTVLNAWRNLSGEMPLRIAGSGPLLEEVRSAAATIPNVALQGWMSREQLLELVRNAAFVIVPSEWYEPFGLTVVEAFACGAPVIASRLGSLESMVTDQVNGLLFEAGNPSDLTEKVRWMKANATAADEMRRQARLVYEMQYTGGRNYQLLMDIYASARAELGETATAAAHTLEGMKRT